MEKLELAKDCDNSSYIVKWNDSLTNKYILIDSKERDVLILGKIIDKYQYSMIFSFKYDSKLYNNIPSYYLWTEDIYVLSKDDIKLLKI